jgi:hypothetical protein
VHHQRRRGLAPRLGAAAPADFATIDGEERVAAALRRFHAADAAVAADLGDLERRTFGFSSSDAPLSPPLATA